MIILLHLFLRIQTRMLCFSFLISSGILVSLKLKIKPATITMGILIISLCSPLFFFSEKLISSSGMIQQTKQEIGAKTGNFYSRVVTYEKYLDLIKKSPILGYGINNSTWTSSHILRLQKKDIYITDVGIINFIFTFGCLGLLWLIPVLFLVFHDLFKISKNFELFSYFLLALFSMPTLDFFIRPDLLFVFGLFVGLVSLSVKQKAMTLSK